MDDCGAGRGDLPAANTGRQASGSEVLKVRKRGRRGGAKQRKRTSARQPRGREQLQKRVQAIQQQMQQLQRQLADCQQQLLEGNDQLDIRSTDEALVRNEQPSETSKHDTTASRDAALQRAAQR